MMHGPAGGARYVTQEQVGFPRTSRFAVSIGTVSGAHSSRDLVAWMKTLQGQAMAQQVGARSYHECSALLNEGVDETFEAATRAAMLVRGEAAQPASSHHRHHHDDETGYGKERRRVNDVQGGDGEGGGCCSGGCVIL